MDKFPTDRLRRLAGLPHSSPIGTDPGDGGDTAAPTVLGGGSDIRLKWHMLRRERRDAPYPRANLAAGLAAAGLDRGDDPVAHLHARGVEVDCWTIDADAPDAPYGLGLAADAGVDQITTNTPGGLARIWARRAGLG